MTSGETIPTPTYHTYGKKPPGVNGEHVDRFQLATPYGPNPGSDGLDRHFARDVLRVVRHRFEEARLAEPEKLKGFVLFGSMVKGRSHLRSDVDAYLFIDPDEPELKQLEWFKRCAVTKDPLEDAINRDLAAMMSSHEDAFARCIINTLEMNERIAEEMADYVVGRIRHDYEPDTLPIEVAAPFMLRVGGGDVLNYRRTILDKLHNSKHPEEAWEALASQIVHCEENRRREGKFYLPDTIEGAYRYFRLEIAHAT